MNSQTLSAQDIAEYLLINASDGGGPPITHLVLQKLLYYSQGFHLALQSEPIFGDEIKAWKHGPVVPSIFEAYRKWRRNPIPCPDTVSADARYDLAPETEEILSVVQSVYGSMPAWKLANLTHEAPPWRKTPRGAVIQHELLREFFLSVVNAGKSGDTISSEPVWPTNMLRHQRRREISASMAPLRDKFKALLVERRLHVET
jgi:uncharacterized phage-associated protein